MLDDYKPLPTGTIGTIVEEIKFSESQKWDSDIPIILTVWSINKKKGK